MKRGFRNLGIAGALFVAAGVGARADVVLSGPDANDGSYTTAALSTAATLNDTVNSGVLTGISLWGLLGGANASSPTSPLYGAITTSTPVGDNGKNAIFRYYLLATNATGQQSVVSLGEIDPNFGGTSTPAPFIAYRNTGGLLAAPQLVLPNQPGRGLSDVTSLQLLAVPALPAATGGITTSLNLTGNVTHPGTYTEATLASNFTSVSNSAAGLGAAVPLWTFLDPSNSNSNNQIVITQGSDGYEVVLALGELDPSLGGNLNDLLPYDPTGLQSSGLARTFFPTDNAHGRWESNLDFISVVDAPEPASLPLLAGALAIMAGVRFRRRSVN